MTVKPITMTLRNACSYSGPCRRTLYNLMYDGSLDTVKVRGRRLVVVESLDKLLLGQAS